MVRPPTSLLQVKVDCGQDVDHVVALQACETAARECGYHVASRTKRALVLAPGQRVSSLFSCLAPGRASVPKSAGQFITAELVVEDDHDGLMVSVAMARAPEGSGAEAFVPTLTSHLQGCQKARSDLLETTTPKSLRQAANFKSEAQAYYFCTRLLCDAAQPAGQACGSFLATFTSRCAEAKDRSSERAERAGLMGDCRAAVEELTRLVEEQLPREAGQKADALAPFIHGAVERCIFSRVCGPLWQLYEQSCDEEDARFAEKAAQLRESESAALLATLGVRPQFCGNLACASSSGAAAPPESPSSRATSGVGENATMERWHSRSSDHTGSGTSVFSGDSMASTVCPTGPYERAAAALAQVEACLLGPHGALRPGSKTPGSPNVSAGGGGCIPREAAEALALAQLEMQTCALEASMGKAELCSMDDILPVFVFVLLRSGLTRPFATAQYIEDSLTSDQRQDCEGKSAVLLESAARHVADEWDVNDVL
eukprot:TRINITY_DN23590_c0_g1_i1.p1 TRINITY_DN23590_c0_g1~~TRINITY_DN23590_c0_g1_i1.p1  ORF type:complete len:486 (-),score=138.27 TRINITY_DN23590_c0_g1_i1:389-1846(-)